MRSFVFLALALLSSQAFGILFPSFKVPHPHAPKDKFGDLEKHLHLLKSDVDKALHFAFQMVDQHKEMGQSLEDVWKNQDKLIKLSGEVEEATSVVFHNLQDILNNQKQLLRQQEAILDLIAAEHHTTRERIAELEKSVRDGLSSLAKNQKTIISVIVSNRKSAEAQFDSAFQEDKKTLNTVQNILKLVLKARQDNQEGQSSILELLFNLGEDVVSAANQLIANQVTIRKSIKQGEENVNVEIGKVVDNQGKIVRDLQDSHKAVVNKLDEVHKEQEKTQERVSDLRKHVLQDITDIRKTESATQHILHKCKASGCDTSDVEAAIKQLLRLMEEFESDHIKAISGILAAEAKTQSAVTNLEKSVSRELTNQADNTLHELKELGDFLSNFLGEIEGLLRAFSKDVSNVENHQETIEHKVKKIEDVLTNINFHKPSSKGKAFFH